MGRNHDAEIAAIPSTLEWAEGFDLSTWKPVVARSRHHEAVIVASGGSYAAAVLLAQLHTRSTGRLAVAVTPLEFMAMGPLMGAAAWLISAGGNNKDILGAFDAALVKHLTAIVVLCGDPKSPLVSRALGVEKAEVFCFEVPAGRDGFLATNSLVAIFSLLLRLHDDDRLNVSPSEVLPLPRIGPADQALLTRDTLVVMYDGWLKAVAIDIESRFSEAALGHVQVCDYRNFAHGRHHWLAKRGEGTSILALVSPESNTLAQRTLAEIPAETSRESWTFESDGAGIALEGLLRSMMFAREAASRIGIDPGRPGVPEFGRRIYELGPLRANPRRDDHIRFLSIERKAGMSIARLQKLGQLDDWEKAFTRFCDALSATRFGGLVLDYDGTVVATKQRFEPVAESVRAELVRLVEEGMRIGIATGRGKSVHKELRDVFPSTYWELVIVGYYNASIVRRLSEDVSDIASGQAVAALARSHRALVASNELRYGVTIDPRPTQITITGGASNENDLWSLTSRILERSGIDGVKVVRSSHSVDVVERSCSKCAVVAVVEESFATRDARTLKIGDRGRWPGNDADLLDTEFSLSVDEVSDLAHTGWNLLGPGLSGAAGTACYLSCVASGRFDPNRLYR